MSSRRGSRDTTVLKLPDVASHQPRERILAPQATSALEETRTTSADTVDGIGSLED
jgi:hypothetical protein